MILHASKSKARLFPSSAWQEYAWQTWCRAAAHRYHEQLRQANLGCLHVGLVSRQPLPPVLEALQHDIEAIHGELSVISQTLRIDAALGVLPQHRQISAEEVCEEGEPNDATHPRLPVISRSIRQEEGR